MAIAPAPPPAGLLTYEAYLTEGEINQRYDIIGGVRRFMPSPTWRHQRIADKITRAFLAYEETSQTGMALSSPFDVMIERAPLRTRQPDVLFISHAQLATIGGIPQRAVLETAPELIVEVISDSDRQQVIDDKLADYISIGVREAWLVLPEARVVQVFRMTADGPILVATYSETQAVQSLSFPDRTVPVTHIFQG